MWVIAKSMLKVLEGFHHHVARLLSDLMLHCFTSENWWECSPVADAMQAVGLFKIPPVQWTY
jgi:hypothetical protein